MKRSPMLETNVPNGWVQVPLAKLENILLVTRHTVMRVGGQVEYYGNPGPYFAVKTNGMAFINPDYRKN